MMFLKRILVALGAAAAVAALGACDGVTNLDRFEQAAAPATVPPAVSNFRALRLTLVNMKPHGAQRFEYRVVSTDNQIVSMGLLLPLGAHPEADGMTSSTVVINVPNAVPRQGDYRLDFYSDVNGSGTYDGIGEVKDKKDHAWRIDSLNGLDPAAGEITDERVAISFTHNMIFTDIDQVNGQVDPARATGADATVRLASMGEFLGKLVELRVVERTSGHLTALTRYPTLAEADLVVVLPGVLDPGVDYDVEVYADTNGDLAFQPTGKPGGDGGWRTTVTAADTGFDVTIDPKAMSAQPGVLFDY